jgi:hypothetical protein
MLGEEAPMDVRRAARRLRAEGVPALAIDDDIAGVARGLAFSEVSCSPAVLDALPPLFWLEAHREDGSSARRISGWVMEKKRCGLAVRALAECCTAQFSCERSVAVDQPPRRGPDGFLVPHGGGRA